MTDRPFPLQTQWIGLHQRQRRPDVGHHWRNIFVAVFVSVIVASAFALAAKPSPKPVVVEPVQRADFNKRYGESITPTVVRVRTVPIVMPVPQPPLPPEKVEVAAVELPPPPSVRPRSVERDICQQHKLRKVMTNGGKSWRCRK